MKKFVPKKFALKTNKIKQKTFFNWNNQHDELMK